MIDRRAEDILQRAAQVRALVGELVAIRTRLVALGLALAPAIDAITAQLASEAKWCVGEAARRATNE